MKCRFCQNETKGGSLNGMPVCEKDMAQITRANGDIAFNDLNNYKLLELMQNPNLNYTITTITDVLLNNNGNTKDIPVK